MEHRATPAEPEDGYLGIRLNPTDPLPAASRRTLRRSGNRTEDSEVGQNHAISLAVREIDPEKSHAVPADEPSILDRPHEEEQQRYDELLGALDEESPAASNWLRSTGVIWAIVLIGAMFTLFVLTQAASLMAQVETLALFWRYVGYASAGILILAFGIAGSRLVVLYLRLRRSPTLFTGALQELAKRQRIRTSDLHRAYGHVFRTLHPLLIKYPLDEGACARLRRWGADDAQLEHLKDARESLVPAQECAEDWIEGFRTRFLRVLDQVAEKRIWHSAVTAGKLTAISPRGTIDAVVVGSLALELIGDLCAIYNLKAGRADTLKILSRVFLTTGISREAEEWSQSAAESMFDSLKEWVPGVLGKAAPAIAGAAADGVANAALISRIGKRTVRAVRPLR